ncbi:MAG: hypothetical protein JST86_06960 [Bacteroidetes bacterium]|nr:hypothetical protein [Bacteroidota bacterium]
MRRIVTTGICLALLFISAFIPVTYTVDNIEINDTGILPGTFIFLLIDFILLAAAVSFTLFRLSNKLPGNFVLKRQHKSLNREFKVLAFWLAFVGSRYVLSKFINISFGTIDIYFIIILFSFFIYDMTVRWYTHKYQPDIIALDNHLLLVKRAYFIKQLQPNHIRQIRYAATETTVTLVFKEGLDNISLPLSDYAFTALQQLIQIIIAANDNALIIDPEISTIFHLPA